MSKCQFPKLEAFSAVACTVTGIVYLIPRSGVGKALKIMPSVSFVWLMHAEMYG